MSFKNLKHSHLAAGALTALALTLVGGGIYWKTRNAQASTPSSAGAAASTPGGAAKGGNSRPVPVIAVPVKTQDVKVTQNALGTVVSQNSVTVRARVSGQLDRVLFKEGQNVKAGEVLAEIDSRPFAAQLAQVQGQAARNQALLRNAQIDLERYQSLRSQNSISAQQVDTQESLVQQYKGTIQADQGLVDSAKLQLGFTRITAPISGRIGLRQVDAGNVVNTTDAGGLAVITSLQPIGVVFTLQEDALPVVASRLADAQARGTTLAVEAWDRGSKNLLAKGTLLTIDNQIDPTSGTIKAKAIFPNTDNTLYPNQFVNVRLLIETRSEAKVVPNAAIQYGSKGPFVYAVSADNTVTVKPVKTGPVDGNVTLIAEGLNAGEQVVINGVDKLREGAKVALSSPRDGVGGGKGKGQNRPAPDGNAPPGNGGRQERKAEYGARPERS